MPVILGLTVTGTLALHRTRAVHLAVNFHLFDRDDRHRRAIPDQAVAQQNYDENADAGPDRLLAPRHFHCFCPPLPLSGKDSTALEPAICLIRARPIS